jgi:DNA/RNA-binding domain of Phe-tRNA-synthetase-like protein
MKFRVYPEVFEKLPNVCFGVVVGYGIDNSADLSGREQLLFQAVEEARKNLCGQDIKTVRQLIPYREAFGTLGFNPNKYPSSIEAMLKRVLKGNDIPPINGVVDICNALSLEYLLPMGAHDMDALEGDIEVRFATGEETFIPLGTADEEKVDRGELVYADQRSIRTRRWIWRQSDRGKITTESRNIFFPIDGFIGENCDRILEARNRLAAMLQKFYGCRVEKFFVDSRNTEVEL